MSQTTTDNVSFKTVQECHIALSWLNKVGGHGLSATQSTDVNTLNQQINDILSKTSPGEVVGKNRRQTSAKELEIIVKDNIISESDFGWLKNHEVATLVFWWELKIKNSNFFIKSSHSSFGENSNTGCTHPIEFVLVDHEEILRTKARVSHQERLDDIIRILNLFIIKKSEHVFSKKELLEKKKDTYINHRKIRMELKWLNKANTDADACKWAWKYTIDYHIKRNVEGSTLSNFDSYNFVKGFHPDEEDKNEYRLAVYAAFELFGESNNDAKELFISKINKAWGQYSLRKSREDKKPINCYIQTDTKKKLEEYCRIQKITITEMIERLINLHCDTIKFK